jgi:hypothetical protein
MKVRISISLAVLMAVVLVMAAPPAAHATGGDLYAAGTAYQAATYSGHPNVFGGGPDWTVDINANQGDMGRAVYAPESGSVAVYSTGYGGGWGNSIVWTSADGREKLHVAHLNDIVKTGAVSGGDLIAHAGTTGYSTGDHMHVSRKYDGAAAPLVLSGHQIVPAYWYNGNQYYSTGPIGGDGHPHPANIVCPIDGGFSKGGAYWWSSGLGVYGRGLYTYCNGNARDSWGRWTFDLGQISGSGRYKVEAFIPSNHATTTNAHYHVNNNAGLSGVSVNQLAVSDVWVDLGTYDFTAGNAWVELDDATGEPYVNSGSPKIGFDCIRITFESPPPQPVLSMVGGVAVSPGPYTVGGTISGSFTVKNTGNAAGTWTPLVLALRAPGALNRDALAAASITLAPGESTSVNFSKQLDVAGDWTGFVSGQLGGATWQSPAGGNIAFSVAPEAIPPHTSISGVPASWTRATVTFGLAATDDAGGSGVKSTHYAIGAGAQQTYTAPVAVATEGQTRVFYWSVDNAGNTETSHTALVRIDKTAPSTACDARGSYTGTATIRLTPTDARSGVAATYYKLDLGAARAGTVASTNVLGTHVLQYWSVDRAGNPEAAKLALFTVRPAPPTPASPSGVALSTSKTSLCWTRAAAGSGVVGYKVERSLSSTSGFSRVATPSAPYFADSGRASGVVYYYRVRAYDGYGGVSAPSTVVGVRTFTVTAARIDQYCWPITYTGSGWTTVTSTALVGGTARRTSRPGDRITVPFRGSAVAWWGTRDPAYGKAVIAIDGVYAATVDLYNAMTLYNQSLYARSGLSDSAHTLTITLSATKNPLSTATRMDADSFVVTGITPGLARDDTAASYSGVWRTRTNTVYSGGTARETTASAASATFVFRGTRVSWIGTRSVARGKARVYIDGVLQATVDQFGAATTYRLPIWTRSGLAPGVHTIKVVSTATRNPSASSTMIDVDGFVVR